jgi:hypothetical protein
VEVELAEIVGVGADDGFGRKFMRDARSLEQGHAQDRIRIESVIVVEASTATFHEQNLNRFG